MNIPKEILNKVKLLELRTRKLVNNILAGEYQTIVKGQGMTFAEFREYIPGDDIRSISWPLTAKAGKPFVKKFDEEREMTLMLLVDVSGSTDFGSGDQLKGEVMVWISALLALTATRNKDQVGLLLFSDQVEHYVPPSKGKGQVHRILRDLFFIKPKSRRTGLASALNYLSGILKKRSVIFIISDFMDQGYELSLKRLARRHEVIAVVVRDQGEIDLPNMGLVDLEDSETGEILTLDTSSKSFRHYWDQLKAKRIQERNQLFKQIQVDRIDIDSHASSIDPLIQFFKRRK